MWCFWLLVTVYWGPRVHTDSPWLQSAAFVLLAFASTTVESSLMINLKIFTSKGMLVQRSGSVQSKHLHFSRDKTSAFSSLSVQVQNHLVSYSLQIWSVCGCRRLDCRFLHLSPQCPGDVYRQCWDCAAAACREPPCCRNSKEYIWMNMFLYTLKNALYNMPCSPIHTSTFVLNAWVLSPWCSLLQIQSIIDKAERLCIQVLSQILTFNPL